MRVILFEDRAHLRSGHRPLWVAELAKELGSQGHEVHVLTSRGWAFASDGRALGGSAKIHTMPAPLRGATSVGERLVADGRRHWGSRWGRPAALTGGAIRQAALLAAIRFGARRVGRPADTVVIVLSMEVRFLAAAVLAPRHGRWTVYEHSPPGPLHRTNRSLTAAVSRLGSWAETRRQRGGGYVRMAVNNAHAGSAWQATYPWVHFEVAPAAGQRKIDPAPREEARRALGFPTDTPIALMFGSAHPSKDVETVLLAFARADGPAHLVLAGVGYTARLDRLRALHPELDLSTVSVFEGFVADSHKHLLHSAADYAVLSFVADNAMDSGTLNDAVAYGLPVVCSESPGVADLVREFELGVLYSPGDADQLRAAAPRAADHVVNPAAQARYLKRFSPAALAQQLLHVASH